MTELRDYSARLAAASGEDSLVLRLQIAVAQDRFMGALQELAGVVAGSGEDSLNEELRARAELVFARVTPNIWELIESCVARSISCAPSGPEPLPGTGPPSRTRSSC